MFGRSRRILFLALGWISLLLGFIGVFLPILPTTPFAILAAYFFSKGSDRMYAWLLRQPALGPLILDWNAHGAIRRRAKILATSMIVPLFTYTLVFVNVVVAIKLVVLSIGIAVLAFIWTRPDGPIG